MTVPRRRPPSRLPSAGGGVVSDWGEFGFQGFGPSARLARGPGRGSRSAPEDAGGVAIDFCEEVFDAVRRSNEVVEVEAQVAVSPVQGPRLAGGGVAKSGDGEAGPLR